MKTFSFDSLFMANVAAAITSRQLWQFPTTNMIENIAVRSNGHILLNTFTNATMYTIDPNDPKAPIIAAQVPNKTALSGIAEVAPDVFAIGAGVLGSYNFTDNSTSVWLVDFHKPADLTATSVSHVADIPEAVIINGFVSLPKNPHIVLTPDSATGKVYRINTLSGEVDVAFANPKLGLPTSYVVPLGMNGLHVHGEYLYFTQSAQKYYGRVKISDTGDKTGAIETVVTMPADGTGYDDFALASDGTAYVSLHANMTMKITPEGEQTYLLDADNHPHLYDPTSVALSRDQKKLYIVTDGASISGGTTGGQVIEVDLC
ncbi:hypothetical protein F5Y16DRAFT_380767 [Xylariaceae sp. FL0255]|nr:hypothetical protein F5Y16DRAFT_380767 [Xylariaceae sp. FL0255]